MEVDRDFLARALSDNNIPAQKALAVKIRETYNLRYSQNVLFLPWSGMKIEETEESKRRPQGCGCECRGCDEGTWHCKKPEKDCHL